MNRFNLHNDYIVLALILLGMGVFVALGMYGTTWVQQTYRVKYPTPTPRGIPLGPSSATTATPSPTVLAATPVPSPVSPSLVDCTVWGTVNKMTSQECSLSQLIERQSKERQQAPVPTFVSLDYKVTPPPTGSPLVATPTPVTCDLAAKATLDANYQREAEALYRDYKSAVGRILASGAADSSATQMAYSAYLTQKNRLDQRYSSQLAALYCG